MDTSNDAEIAFLVGRLADLGFDVHREKQLELALSIAMDLLMRVVDSESVDLGIRCDAQQLLRRWQRGEFLKSSKMKS